MKAIAHDLIDPCEASNQIRTCRRSEDKACFEKPSHDAMLTPSCKIIAIVVAAISFVTVSRDEALEQHGTRRRLDQTRELFDECTGTLQTINPTSRELSKEDFSLLLEVVSHGELQDTYEKLPLECSCLFNMHACRNDRGCVGTQANISISSQEEREFLCLTLASMLSQSRGE